MASLNSPMCVFDFYIKFWERPAPISHPSVCRGKPIATAGVTGARACVPTTRGRAASGSSGQGAAPVTSERWACRPLGWPTGSCMEWIDWLIGGLLAVAMGSLAIYALVMFTLALPGRNARV